VEEARRDAGVSDEDVDRILEVWEYLRAEPDEIRELGAGTYRVSGRLRAKHATSSTEIVSPYVQHFEMRDGLLFKGTMTTSPDRARDTESVEGGRRGEAA
jgi:hypothetical protein